MILFNDSDAMPAACPWKASSIAVCCPWQIGAWKWMRRTSFLQSSHLWMPSWSYASCRGLWLPFEPVPSKPWSTVSSMWCPCAIVSRILSWSWSKCAQNCVLWLICVLHLILLSSEKRRLSTLEFLQLRGWKLKVFGGLCCSSGSLQDGTVPFKIWKSIAWRSKDERVEGSALQCMRN